MLGAGRADAIALIDAATATRVLVPSTRSISSSLIIPISAPSRTPALLTSTSSCFHALKIAW